MTYLQERQAAGEVVTGLLYLEADPQDLHDYINTVAKPLNELGDTDLIPGIDPLDKYNAANR
jgi:2-oxoglutarate/2-oxoacid ferredoxin oxidoreductase subunit beta